MSDPSAMEDLAWTLNDEVHSSFIEIKYGNRQQLAADWRDKRKLADKGRFLADGKTPNPQHPRLQFEADLAQTRYDIAYVVAKNQQMQQRMEMLYQLFDRVGMLEGAYSYLRNTIDFAKSLYEQMSRREPTPKEQKNVTSETGRKG